MHFLKRQEAGDKAKLELLRGSVGEGLDVLDRGDYTTLETDNDIDAFFVDIHSEVKAKQ